MEIIDKPLVSIAMATYNGARYLKEQIHSILSQSYSNIELIITDDASTDETCAILKLLAQEDSRIKLILNLTNRGFVSNFERALKCVNGEYIALADQDDIWEEQKIEKLLNAINGYSLIHSDAFLIDEHNNVIHSSHSNNSKKIIQKDIKGYFIANNVTGCTALFSAKLLDDLLPFPPEVILHDWWIAIVAMKHHGVVYLDEPLVRYRQHHSNLIGSSKGNTFPIFEKRVKLIEEYLLFLKMLQNRHLLNQNDTEFLYGLIKYHHEFLQKGLRFHSLFFYLKNIAIFYKNKSQRDFLLGLLTSPFGAKFQKALWRLLA
ncbi:MAG: glycosyltransferase family 2 protein [Campylobacterales bacterium]|nr:glycosyltransferase family 2 protein [Campylobacterales bacterium]